MRRSPEAARATRLAPRAASGERPHAHATLRAARVLVAGHTRLLIARDFGHVAGGVDSTRSSLGQVNAQAMWGLAAAVRSEMRKQPVTVSELRLNMRFNR